MPLDIREGKDGLTCIISSEDDAWELLKRVTDGEFGDEPVLPRFRGWPDTEFIFWVGREHEVLTAPMMEGMLAYQAGLYRSFLLITEDTTNLRSLSEEQRREFEMRVKVGRGCTKLIPDWQELANQFVSKVVGHMNGTEITVTVLGFALLFAGAASWKAWLDYRTKKAAEEARNENTRLFLQQQQFATQADLEKTKMLTDAVQAALGSRALIDASEEGKQGILKAAARVDETEVAGVDLPPEIAQKVARNYRVEPEAEGLEGQFRVVRTDAAPDGRFRVRLVHEETGESFFAGIRDALVAGDDREVISEAEWTQTPFIGRVEVKRQRGEITSATVVDVQRPH